MKLRELELEQFRKFDRPLRITGMADGLNLIVGPNEMGKSTLFAALQAVLFERHRSQAQTIRSFQPAGHEGASPRVALSFEIDGQPYRIEKRFLRRPGAELALPDGRHLHGEVAEEALDGLLASGGGNGQIGGRRSAAEALGIWSLVWVGQGQSFALPEMAPGARGTLQTILEAEVGEVLGGDHGAALIKSIEQALYELVYKTGRPRGQYKETDDARQALEIEIVDLEARREELERDLNELDSVRAEYERVRADQSATQAEAELAELMEWRDQLMVQRAEIREAEADLKEKRTDLEHAEAEQTRGRTLREALAAAEAECQAAAAVEADAASAALETERLTGEQGGKVDRLQATFDAAGIHHRGLQRLTHAIRQRDDARAALRAAASEVALDLDPAALERVRVAGRPLGEPGRSFRIVDPLEIEITEVGRITVRPVVPDRRRLQGSLREAERRIAEELKALGLRPPSATARQLEFDLAAGGPLPGATARLGAKSEGASPWPEAATVESALAEAERRINALLSQLRQARVELAASVDGRQAKGEARSQAVARREHAEQRLEQLRADLAEAERLADETDLAERALKLRGDVEFREQRLRQLHEQAPEQSLEDLERRIAELRGAVARRAGALHEQELAMERLRARIQALAGGGVDERLASARRRCDELERECAKYRREVEALELLLRVLQDAERDAKERYLGPLVRRIRPYLEALFPGADLEVDEGFRITTVARMGGAEPFDRLSDGTREQIAILTRLAFAQLLADQGRPAVVVLDDALVFSDDQRIEQMFEILARAAAKLQIIVLTCRERVFQGLAAHRLRLEEAQAAGVE
ncbi:MAG: AAA family ATPase [Geminicoccaceae bacterium]